MRIIRGKNKCGIEIASFGVNATQIAPNDYHFPIIDRGFVLTIFGYVAGGIGCVITAAFTICAIITKCKKNKIRPIDIEIEQINIDYN